MKLINLPRIMYENNRNYIYRILKESVIALYIEPGEAISETLIQNELSMSRGPIREALAVLSVEGLVDVYPQKKSIITKIDMNVLDQYSHMREVLERDMLKNCLLAGRTKELVAHLEDTLNQMEQLNVVEDRETMIQNMLKLDDQFHSMVFKLMDCGAIWDTMRIANNQYNRFQALRRKAMLLDEFVGGHRKIVSYIRAENLADLDIRFDESRSSFKINLKKVTESYPQYFSGKL